MSIIPFERLNGMKAAGLGAADIKIIEDFTRIYMPQSRWLDPVDEAIRRWRETKRLAAEKAREQQAEARRLMARKQQMQNFGEIESMANGRIYSDRAAYRRDLAAMGYLEVGNEDTIKEAERVKARMAEEKKKQQQADIDKAVSIALRQAGM